MAEPVSIKCEKWPFPGGEQGTWIQVRYCDRGEVPLRDDISQVAYLDLVAQLVRARRPGWRVIPQAGIYLYAELPVEECRAICQEITGWSAEELKTCRALLATAKDATARFP